MYEIIQRLSIVIIGLAIIIVVKNVKKKAFRTVLVICVVLGISACSLFGGSLLRFQTPEDAAHFLSTGKVVGFVEGEDSCMVITQVNDTDYQNDYLMKVGNEYRILNFFEHQEQTIYTDNGVPVIVSSIKGTADHYATSLYSEVFGSGMKDSNGTVFQVITNDAGKEFGVVSAYARVGPVDEDYQVMVTTAHTEESDAA